MTCAREDKARNVRWFSWYPRSNGGVPATGLDMTINPTVGMANGLELSVRHFCLSVTNLPVTLWSLDR